MRSKFQMSMMGELTFILGLQVRQRPDRIFINQAKYVQDLIKRFDLDGSKSVKTPTSTSFHLDADFSCNPVDQKNYRTIIATLLYLMASRPRSFSLLVFVHCDPKESHLAAVKRILKYLKGTPNFGPWCPKDSGFELTAFTGRVHLVPATSLEQVGVLNCVSLSTAEAEYVTVASCCSQVLWMQTQLADYGYTMRRILIYYDSKSVIYIMENPIQHSRMKHIDIRYKFINDHLEKGNIELYFVDSDNQLVDLFTKSFDEKHHFFLLSKIGMLDLPAENSCLTLFRGYTINLEEKYQTSIEAYRLPFRAVYPKTFELKSGLFDQSNQIMADQGENPPSPIDEVADELCPTDRILSIIEKNSFVDLEHFVTEHQVIIEVLRAHPVAYTMSTTAHVPVIYVQQFWNTARLERRNRLQGDIYGASMGNCVQSNEHTSFFKDSRSAQGDDGLSSRIHSVIYGRRIDLAAQLWIDIVNDIAKSHKGHSTIPWLRFIPPLRLPPSVATSNNQ
ncbi:LOW QUALITY PROTEIN: hypothetical protein OSB04_024057 [Centaurea solstitialis]|uniref:Reverse transcriptase Ty1/copia-type domain-containing protein n=1 Tax=Centaurea solstitialis TaxID=347529 RepID=A0AA38SKD3_9ASTR|nr:LOW QUALITY PROTEIN: hypothetical protein OSB04_024057 [Centaurea solstitialis]